MSNQIVISSGAKVRSLEGVLTGTAGIVNSVPLGGANGVATLDSLGKVPLSQLPASVVTYLGTWNAATNTPTLTNGVGDVGDLYICNVAGTVNFGAGPITFAVGDWVIYSGTEWQKSSGASGTVTSVAVTESGDALTITGSPITTSGTINIGFAGTGSQYIKGDGTLATFPTTIDQAKRLITEVYNSTGATLSKGTVVYINGGQGNLPTVTKAQANADNTSAQTYGVVQSDITNMNNGYVVVIGSLTDIDTQAYTVGTQLYLSGTTAGAWTSTKPSAPIHLVYVGIVVRSHPTQGVVEIRIQNGYELEELHDVAISAPVNNQGIFYNSSNSLWENKSIATALGYTPANDALVVHLAGTETITGAKTFTDNTIFSASPLFDQSANYKVGASLVGTGNYISMAFDKSGTGSGSILSMKLADGTTAKAINLDFLGSPATYTYTFPNLSGTIALLEGTQTFSGAKTFSSLLTADSSLLLKNGVFAIASGYTNLAGNNLNNGLVVQFYGSGGTAITNNLNFNATTGYNYTFPATSGTIALTSNLSSYLPLTGGTLTGALNGTSATFSSVVSAIADSNAASFIAQARTADDLAQIQFKNNAASNTNALISVLKVGTNGGQIQFLTKPDGSPLAASLTLASTGAATFSSSVTATQATFTATANTYAGGSLVLKAFGGTNPIYLTSVSGYFALSNGGGADHLLINSTGAATFSSSVTANSGIIDTGGFNIKGTGGVAKPDMLRLSNASASGYYWDIWRDNTTGYLNIGGATGGSVSTFLTIKDVSGNVGIGTSSPQNLLHIKAGSSGLASYDARYKSIIENNGEAYYVVTVPDNSYAGLRILGTSTSGKAGFEYYMTDDNLLIYSNGYQRFMTAGTERMRITSGGNVGIGATGYASTRLLVRGSTSTSSSYTVNLENSGTFVTFAVRDDGFIETGTRSVSPYNNATTGRTMVVESGGGLGYLVSTRQSKTNIEQLTDVSWLYKLNPVSFNYRKKDSEMKYTEEFNKEKWYGLIADEVEIINKDLVFYNTKEDNSKELAGVEYTKIISALVKAVQEQQAQIEELKALINK